MLVVEVFAKFSETNSPESFLVEGRVISTAQEAVATKDECRLEFIGKILLGRAADMTRQFA